MRRPVIFVLLALAAASFAAIVVYSALKRREAQVQQAMAESVKLVVAAHDLPIGSRIDSASVKLVRWSRDSLPPGSTTDLAMVIGQYTRTGFVENEPIVADRLFSGDKNAGLLPLLIPNGMRAMSVPVDEVSDISGFVLPNTRVDVLVSLTQGDKSLSRIVLQNVEVLAVAQDIEQVNDQPQPVRVVTVLVTPQEAERLTLASHEGSLRLAMRNYVDNQIVSTEGIDVSQMMGGNSAPPPVTALNDQPPPAPPAPPRPRPVQVEVLRDGRTEETISFVRGNDLRDYGSAGVAASLPPERPRAPQPPPTQHIPDLSPEPGGAAPTGIPVTNTSLSPLGALSPSAAAYPAAAGIADGAAPPAVLVPPPSYATSSADSSGGGFDGPKSHTIDVP